MTRQKSSHAYSFSTAMMTKSGHQQSGDDDDDDDDNDHNYT
jgi:hypothetical protein